MNLYNVQDNDRPMFVIASSYSDAIAKWVAVMAIENELAENEIGEPLGVQLVAEEGDIIV